MTRPASYTEDLGIEIAARIAEGATLKEVAADEAMPSVRTMMRWSHEHPEFDRRYNVAQREKADTIVGEAITISDETVVDNAQASRQRTRVETRLKVAQMLNPAKYGQRLGIGAAPELPQLGDVDPIEAARRIAFVFAQAEAVMQRNPAAPKPLVLGDEPAPSAPSAAAPRGRTRAADRPRRLVDGVSRRAWAAAAAASRALWQRRRKMIKRCPDGEIGRRSGLKIRGRKAYGFESRSGYQSPIRRPRRRSMPLGRVFE